MKVSILRSGVATLVSCLLGVPSFPVVAVAQDGRIGVAAARHGGTVSGRAWHHDNTPVAHAQLRLRDVADGDIVMRGQTDAAGRFSFTPVSPGTYVVELVDDDDRVLGVGHTFGLVRGETVATFIRLGTQVPWHQGFFTNAAAAALATAASLGVTALGSGVQPASPRN